MNLQLKKKTDLLEGIKMFENLMNMKIIYLHKPEAHRPQRSPECTAMKAIFSQNTEMLHARKINLSFAMATNQIQQFRLNFLWL